MTNTNTSITIITCSEKFKGIKWLLYVTLPQQVQELRRIQLRKWQQQELQGLSCGGLSRLV